MRRTGARESSGPLHSSADMDVLLVHAVTVCSLDATEETVGSEEKKKKKKKKKKKEEIMKRMEKVAMAAEARQRRASWPCSRSMTLRSWTCSRSIDRSIDGILSFSLFLRSF